MNNNNSKKILIIAIIVILVLAIAGAVVAYLATATDTFKSSKELFMRYMSKNIQKIEQLKNSDTYNTYKSLENENAYEQDIKMKIGYAVGGEVSNPLNDLAIVVKKQKDNLDEYSYTDAQVLYKDEEYLESELIQNKEILGIRFTDIVKQFITVRDGENLDVVAEDMEVDIEDLQDYIQMIAGTKSITEKIISKEQIETLKNKYTDIIKNNLQNATYSKLNKAMITVNDQTVQTSAYTAKLSQEQTRTLVLEILNNIRNENIIIEKLEKIELKEKFETELDKLIEEITDVAEYKSIEITVYEQNGEPLKMAMVFGTNKFAIEALSNENSLDIKIQNSIINEENIQEQTIDITKTNSEKQEEYNINIKITEGEEEKQINIKNTMEKNSDNISITTVFDYIKGINQFKITNNNNIKLLEEIEERKELNEQNNVILNDLATEPRKNIIGLLKQRVPEKIETRLNLLAEVLELNLEQEENPEDEVSQVEINRFNAKFEFYTGESVSSENVQQLMEVVKENLSSANITPIVNPEDTEETDPNKLKVKIQLNIEKDVKNEELAEQVLEKIIKNKKYTVSIEYKETNNLIESIIITEVE